jgi:transcriptional regulator with XRE-family HTH domain
MTKIGERIILLRKNKGWSQTELAQKTGASREAIGKYERSEATPSIDTAKKIADILEVSLDYLVEENGFPVFDKKTVNRLQKIQKLNEVEKSHVYAMLDAFLLKSSIQKDMAS